MSNRGILIALYANAAALVALLAYFILAGQPLQPAAFAQVRSEPLVPSATGDLSIVPVQMSPNTWGCYLLDPRAQVLCIYQYIPGERLLRLQAARNIAYDRKLGAFNTAPLPREVADLVSKEASGENPTVPGVPPREPGK